MVSGTPGSTQIQGTGGADMVLIWLLSAVFALCSLRTRGSLYLLYLIAGLLALAASGWCSLTLGVFWICGKGLPLAMRGVGVGLVLGIAIGTCLVLLMARSRRLPGWLEATLPVRGVHAHRLLAAVALLVVAGPAVTVASLFIGSVSVPTHPVIGMVLAAAGFVGYFTPLWSHLASD